MVMFGGVGVLVKAIQTGKDLYLNKLFSNPDCVKWEDAVRQKSVLRGCGHWKLLT